MSGPEVLLFNWGIQPKMFSSWGGSGQNSMKVWGFPPYICGLGENLGAWLFTMFNGAQGFAIFLLLKKGESLACFLKPSGFPHFDNQWGHLCNIISNSLGRKNRTKQTKNKKSWRSLVKSFHKHCMLLKTITWSSSYWVISIIACVNLESS